MYHRYLQFFCYTGRCSSHLASSVVTLLLQFLLSSYSDRIKRTHEKEEKRSIAIREQLLSKEFVEIENGKISVRKVETGKNVAVGAIGLNAFILYLWNVASGKNNNGCITPIVIGIFVFIGWTVFKTVGK